MISLYPGFISSEVETLANMSLTILRKAVNSLAVVSVISFIQFSNAITLPSNYDTIWTTQSANSSGSMPVGGGDIGLNAWAENGE
jgi:hypothetical protein